MSNETYDAPRLLLLSDRSQLHLGRSLRRTLLECVEAGATHIVLRELDEEPDAREALAAALVAAGATVIAAHWPLPSASGVHLPAGGSVPAPGIVFGRSCHSSAEVHAAAAEGAAYVTLSPFALTESKPGYGPALPPSEYAAAAAAAVPVYALGGITPDNAADAIAAGVHGVAVIGEVMRADDPASVVRELLEALAGSGVKEPA
jgi:thiamine-phosphate pyrophosphorylase